MSKARVPYDEATLLPLVFGEADVVAELTAEEEVSVRELMPRDNGGRLSARALPADGPWYRFREDAAMMTTVTRHRGAVDPRSVAHAIGGAFSPH